MVISGGGRKGEKTLSSRNCVKSLSVYHLNSNTANVRIVSIPHG